MERAIDLSNSDNWRLVWEKLTIAERVIIDPEKQFHSIPTIDMPVQLTSSIFAVLVKNSKASPKWHYAGKMFQSIQTGIIDFSADNDVEVAQSRELYLNRVSVYICPKITATFSLKFEVPRWFEEVVITVWEYAEQDQESLQNA